MNLQKDRTDLTKVLNQYLRHKKNLCLISIIYCKLELINKYIK